MIFMRYESFRSYLKMYPVTSAILAINLAVQLLVMFRGDQLIYNGAFYVWPGDPFGLVEPWRYFTSMWLHGGWQHLLFNCFSILVFAPPLERLLGHVKYTLLYVLSGIVGNLATAIVMSVMSESMISVGASGAVYGVFGSFLYFAVVRKGLLDAASTKTIYTILVIGVIYSVIMQGINLWAHLGGALGGFLIMGVFDRIGSLRLRYNRH